MHAENSIINNFWNRQGLEINNEMADTIQKTKSLLGLSENIHKEEIITNNNHQTILKTCVVCGRKFESSIKRRNKTCSVDCLSKHLVKPSDPIQKKIMKSQKKARRLTISQKRVYDTYLEFKKINKKVMLTDMHNELKLCRNSIAQHERTIKKKGYNINIIRMNPSRCKKKY